MFCDFNRELQALLIDKSDQVKQAQIAEKLETFKQGIEADLYHFFTTPFIFSKADFEQLSISLKHILDAQTNIMNQIYQQRSKQEILDYFFIPNPVRPFINWERLLSGDQTVARLDIVPHKTGYSVVDINLHTCVGGMTCGHAYDLVMESLALEPFYAHGKVSAYVPLAQKIKTLCKNNDFERLVILDWQSNADKGRPSFELMQLSFIRAGLNLPVVTHTEESFPKEWLTPEEAKKTLVYRGFSLDEIEPHDTFVQALMQSQACVLHGFEDELRTNKRWLALLWDEAYQARLTKAQKEAIQTYLPYSCLLTQDKLPHFLANKDKYIFKANEGSRSQGILIGKAFSAAKLEAKLLAIGIENILVQTFMETDSLAILQDQQESAAEHKFVLGLYLVGDKSQGLAIRGSTSSAVVKASHGMAKTGWAAVINEQQKAGILAAIKQL